MQTGKPTVTRERIVKLSVKCANFSQRRVVPREIRVFRLLRIETKDFLYCAIRRDGFGK